MGCSWAVQARDSLGERHLMITMFQVNHREDPPPVLLLQHVLNEGQRIAVVLRLGVQAR